MPEVPSKSKRIEAASVLIVAANQARSRCLPQAEDKGVNHIYDFRRLRARNCEGMTGATLQTSDTA